MAGIGRLGHPLRGGWSHSPPVGKGGDEDDDVTFVREGGFVLSGVFMTSLYWMAGIDVLHAGIYLRYARTDVRVGM